MPVWCHFEVMWPHSQYGGQSPQTCAICTYISTKQILPGWSDQNAHVQKLVKHAQLLNAFKQILITHLMTHSNITTVKNMKQLGCFWSVISVSQHLLKHIFLNNSAIIFHGILMLRPHTYNNIFAVLQGHNLVKSRIREIGTLSRGATLPVHFAILLDINPRKEKTHFFQWRKSQKVPPLEKIAEKHGGVPIHL